MSNSSPSAAAWDRFEFDGVFQRLGCFLLLLLTVIGQQCLAESRPNIIYILADDLGYGDLGCYGSEKNLTPHIDRLAAGGVRLTDFHAAAWCAPSRRALMTGCHPNRPWNLGEERWGRLAAATTLPEMLREAGYSTALLGKWHLEMAKGLQPFDQGFDYWYGTRGSNDWDGPRPNFGSFRDAPESAWKTPLYINRENKGPVVPQSMFTRKYTEEAIRLIGERGEAPFFIYLAHNMPHVPIFASEAFRGKSRNGVYGDVIAELDWSVGEIVKALTAAGIRNETLVVFTSDNGPWTMFGVFGGLAKPLRGEKSTTWEGGERVPCIVSWPGKIGAAVRSDLMVNSDMYATLARMAGASVPDGQAIDSIDLSSMFLAGNAGTRTKHIYYFREAMAYRNGQFKLHMKTRERTRNPETGAREPSLLAVPPLLFDLKADPSESRNISMKRPKVAERLLLEFVEAQKAIENWERY